MREAASERAESVAGHEDVAWDPAVAPDTTEHAREAYLPKPRPERHGVALCLSGGGSRAALFHLGVLRRLNETGVLSQVTTISSVSGGSILAAHLARTVPVWPAKGDPIPSFQERVVHSFEAFVRKNLRTAPLAERLLPWNLLRERTQIDKLVRLFDRHLNGARIEDLPGPPDAPRYVFCATDNVFATNWTIERERMGDYMAGYTREPPQWTVGRAAAASSCFPPLFDPMPIDVSPADLSRGDYRGDDRDALIRGLKLSDGGLYDNLALEPVWNDHEVVIVSDGGATFDPQADSWLWPRLKRYSTLMGVQATKIRKRWLIASYATQVMGGAYIGIGSPVANYRTGGPGYPEKLVDEVVSEVRTDLDAFSRAEIGVLQNHGYLIAEAALAKHLSRAPLKITPAPLHLPARELMDPSIVRGLLADSHRRKLPFGRGRWLPYVFE